MVGGVALKKNDFTGQTNLVRCAACLGRWDNRLTLPLKSYTGRLDIDGYRGRRGRKGVYQPGLVSLNSVLLEVGVVLIHEFSNLNDHLLLVSTEIEKSVCLDKLVFEVSRSCHNSQVNRMP